MNSKKERLILAEITNNIVIELQKRISNIDNQIELIPKEERANWKGQKAALNDSIKIVQNEFMKKINTESNHK